MDRIQRIHDDIADREKARQAVTNRTSSKMQEAARLIASGNPGDIKRAAELIRESSADVSANFPV
jgi:hypothetical protein